MFTQKKMAIAGLLLLAIHARTGAEAARTSLDPPATLVRSVHAEFDMVVPAEGGRGLGILLLNADAGVHHDDLPGDMAWDEPNLAGALGLAFDVHNPPPTATEPTEEGRPPMSWFDEFGNFYNRPQREISLHFDGRERHNMLCPVEFRTGEPVRVAIDVRFEPGAAFISLSLDGQSVLDDHMLPGIPAFRPLVMLGVALGADDEATIEADHLTATFGDMLAAPDPPVQVTVFDEQFVHSGDMRPKTTVDFSAVPRRVERVVATLTLSEPEVGYDHWDKKGAVWLWQPGDGKEDAERFEIIRFITPFRKGWTWHVDVTDFLPLFTDAREIGLSIDTYMKGWLLTLSLDFYPGQPALIPIEVRNVWNGSPEIGNPDQPANDFYASQEIVPPQNAQHAAMRIMVTGHGMAPNTDNAGEFMPIWRTFRAASGDCSMSVRNRLWNEQVYLNPCRPQRGTWKFDRAAWAPGSVVEPWVIDLAGVFKPRTPLTVEYALDDYINENRGQTWAPHHWTEAQVVFYARPDESE